MRPGHGQPGTGSLERSEAGLGITHNPPATADLRQRWLANGLPAHTGSPRDGDRDRDRDSSPCLLLYSLWVSTLHPRREAHRTDEESGAQKCPPVMQAEHSRVPEHVLHVTGRRFFAWETPPQRDEQLPWAGRFYLLVISSLQQPQEIGSVVSILQKGKLRLRGPSDLLRVAQLSTGSGIKPGELGLKAWASLNTPPCRAWFLSILLGSGCH